MDEKKKIMIVGSLLVVMLGVGAFQFMASSPAPAPTAEATDKTISHEDKATEVAEKATAAVNEGEAAANPEGEKPPVEGEKKPEDPAQNAAIQSGEPIEVAAYRDPFDGRKWSGEVASKTPVMSGGGQAVPPQQSYRPPTQRIQRNIEIPPAGGFNISKEGGIPGVGGAPGGAPQTMGGPNMPSIEDVPYEVTGTIRGKRQAALFKDGNGGQRLVRVGDKLDGDTVVVGVDKGKVLVKHRGKVKALEVNRNAPKAGEKPKSGVENLSSGGQ